MRYEKYKTAISPLCPVAIQLRQFDVHAPEHIMWGIVTCEACRKQFAIGRNRIHSSLITDVQAAEALAIILADDHRRNQSHQSSYEIYEGQQTSL